MCARLCLCVCVTGPQWNPQRESEVQMVQQEGAAHHASGCGQVPQEEEEEADEAERRPAPGGPGRELRRLEPLPQVLKAGPEARGTEVPGRGHQMQLRRTRRSGSRALHGDREKDRKLARGCRQEQTLGSPFLFLLFFLFFLFPPRLLFLLLLSLLLFSPLLLSLLLLFLLLASVRPILRHSECCVLATPVDLSEYGMGDSIVAPSTLMATTCDGTCTQQRHHRRRRRMRVNSRRGVQAAERAGRADLRARPVPALRCLVLRPQPRAGPR